MIESRVARTVKAINQFSAFYENKNSDQFTVSFLWINNELRALPNRFIPHTFAFQALAMREKKSENMQRAVINRRCNEIVWKWKTFFASHFISTTACD